jgi:uncharacterized protein
VLCAAAERATRVWLDESVRGRGLCPFAPAAAHVRCVASPAVNGAALTEALLHEAALLDELPPSQPATTLLIAPRCAEARDYYSFLDWLRKAELKAAMLGLAGPDGSLQLVAFHPRWRCEGEDENDAASYTNRTPFPTVHLLREADVDAAQAARPGCGEEVPRRNSETLRRIGVDALEARLRELQEGVVREALLGRQ